METVASKNILGRIRHGLRLDRLPLGIRRIIVGIIGGTILLLGFALIFLPGPAIVVIPLGLAILATEFAWARHYLQKARGLIKRKNKSENDGAK